MPEQPTLASWRQWLRISIRGLIVLVLLAGTWLGWMVRSARVQRDAVAAIKKSRGLVQYEWESKNGRRILKGRPWCPEWLVERVGIDYVGRVTYVGFGKRMSDADLVPVGHLRQLERFDLYRSPVTDAGLIHLRGLTRLQRLVLVGSKVSDAGLEHLAGLTGLESLMLTDAPITDAGLVHLKELTKLKELSLAGTAVTDAGVGELQKALPLLRVSR
jgi:hypothetical protein